MSETFIKAWTSFPNLILDNTLKFNIPVIKIWVIFLFWHQALYLLKGQTRQQLGNLCEVQANDLMTRMDLNDDKALSKDEFIQGCMAEKDLSKLLSGQ